MDSRTVWSRLSGLAGLKASDTSYVALCLFRNIYQGSQDHENGWCPGFVLVFYDLYVTHDLSDDFGALWKFNKIDLEINFLSLCKNYENEQMWKK